MQPTLDGHPHFGKVACEEVVPGDKYQLFRVSGLRNDFLQRVVRAVLVVVAADEELRFCALPQERERKEASIGLDRRAKRNQCANVRIGTRSAQPSGRTKGKTDEDDGQRELIFQPSQRGLYVGNFTAPLVVPACAQARTAKVEAQHRKAERVQSLHGVKDHLVVHRATAQRMRMAH